MRKDKWLFLSAALLLTVKAAAPVSAHSEMPLSLEKIVKKAGCIAVAVIEDVQISKTRCSTRTEISVRMVEFIRGTCPVRDVSFIYAVYYWKQARFPWQEDCPSVHYTIPPRIKKPRKGDRVIVTVEYFRELKHYYVTSMSEAGRRGEIEKMK